MNKCKTKQIEIYEEQKWTKLGLHVIGSAFHTLKNKRMEMNADKRLRKKLSQLGLRVMSDWPLSSFLLFFISLEYLISFPLFLSVWEGKDQTLLMTYVQKLKVVVAKL